MKKLNRLFFSVGIFQCIILILIYLVLFFAKNDFVLVCSFLYSLFLGFFSVKNRNDNLLANNNVLIFHIFLFLYGAFPCVTEIILLPEITKVTYTSAVIYAVTIPSYIIGTSLYKPKQYNIVYEKNIIRYKPNPIYNNILIIFLILLILYITYSFYSIGALFNPSVLEKDRSALFGDRNQLDVVVGLLISAIFLYFIYYYKKMPRKIMYTMSIILFYYIALQLSAGNRRDFMPMILGGFWVFVNLKKIKFTAKIFVLLLLAISVFQYLGTVRSSLADALGKNMSLQDNIVLTLTSNEFVYPYYTLSFDVDNYAKNNLDLKYGESYLYPIMFFVPRAIYPDKPESLSNQFIKRNFGNRYTMGFAYTPISEAFVNFGYLGPCILYFFLGILIIKIQNKRSQVINFILFTMILDLSRGESGTFVYQFFFTALFILIIPNFIKFLHIR